jgi:hypothetical protein
MASPIATTQVIPPTTPANYRIPFNTKMPTTTPASSSGTPGFTAYDQYDLMQKMFPGFNLQRGPGSVQSSVQGTDITQFGRPIGQDPNFTDVISPLYRGGNAGNPLFQQGLALTEQDYTMSPETLQVQQSILEQGARARAQAIADQQALAAQYGRGGSSTEAFGVAQAGTLADEATQKNLTALSLQNLQRQQAAKDLATKGLFERSDLQLQDENQRMITAAGLTSDEVASLRNLSEADKNRVLQERLGVLGINTAQFTSSAEQQTAKDIAKQNNNPLNFILQGGAAGIASPF